ncbi:hypothetical protein ABT160_46000 [Streptomyces sp. NPDC001941]|uniref:hypothetical protein n=1 Tax=Streptomyces sp. NPDC001941 TaxID=3154659 RepID=UPI0033177DAB
MQAESLLKRLAPVLAAVVFATVFVVAGPNPPRAEALPNPCNLSGGRAICGKVEEGAKWLYEKSGTGSLVEGVSEAVDFASDPLGYMEQKLRQGTKSMFGAFGEELTGKNPNESEKGKAGKNKDGTP